MAALGPPLGGGFFWDGAGPSGSMRSAGRGLSAAAVRKKMVGEP